MVMGGVEASGLTPFAAVRVNVQVPVDVGTPPNAPLGAMMMPGGSDPEPSEPEPSEKVGAGVPVAAKS